MIHDKERVQKIRAYVASQTELIKSLQAQIVKGGLDNLDVALKQTEDIETIFLAELERNDRTPIEESRWLFMAEYMLSIWGPRLKVLKDHFGKSGSNGIEVVGA